MNTILNCIPIFTPDSLVYKRSEKNGNMTIISKSHQETAEMLLNEISVFILNQCNNKNTIENIIENILKEYRNADRNLVIDDTMKLFYTLWRIGCIEWRKENPYDILYTETKGDNCYKLLSEHEVLITEDILNHNYVTSPYCIKEIDYCKTFIGQRICRLSEIFFLLKVNDQYISRISLLINENSRSMEIGSFYINSDTNDYLLIRDFFDWCLKQYDKLSQNTHKIRRILIYLSEGKYNKLELIIQKIGFNKIGMFKNEFGYNSPDVFAYEYLI